MFAVSGLGCKVRVVGLGFTIKGLRLKLYGFPTKCISVEVLCNCFWGNENFYTNTLQLRV